VDGGTVDEFKIQNDQFKISEGMEAAFPVATMER
jgi:hypothetical protein